MKSTRLRAIIILITMLGFSLEAKAAAMRLVYGYQGTDPGQTVSGKLIIVCWSSAMFIQDGRQWALYDFAKRRLYKINKAKGTYDSLSLYSDISGRVAEFQRREAELTKEGADAAAFTEITRLETYLGILDPSIDKSINYSMFEKDGGLEFKLGDDTVLGFVASSQYPVPQGGARVFARALNYAFRLHPCLKDKINEDAMIPLSITCAYDGGGGESSRKFTLMKYDTIKAGPGVVMKGLKYASGFDPELAELMVAASKYKKLDAEKMFEDTVARAK